MGIGCWLQAWEQACEQDRDALEQALAGRGVKALPFQGDAPPRWGACVFCKTTPELQSFIQIASRAGEERVIAIARSGASLSEHRNFLQAGASDVLHVGS